MTMEAVSIPALTLEEVILVLALMMMMMIVVVMVIHSIVMELIAYVRNL